MRALRRVVGVRAAAAVAVGAAALAVAGCAQFDAAMGKQEAVVAFVPGTAQATTYLGAKDVATSGGGTVNFSASLGAIVPAGQIIKATATDSSGNTSALSAGRASIGTR